MSDKDLIGKADGLMRRHSGIGTDTSAFPVLTDLVDSPPSVAPIESVALPPAGPDAPVPSALTADAAHAEELAARVMKRVEERLEVEMQRVRRELAAAAADAVREVLGDRPVK